MCCRDTVRIIELDDEQVDGVAIYLTDYNRSITERLAKDLFSDPSQASLTCVAKGPVTIKDVAAVTGSEGKEIFKERKALNLFQNKVLRRHSCHSLVSRGQDQPCFYVAGHLQPYTCQEGCCLCLCPSTYFQSMLHFHRTCASGVCTMTRTRL